MKLIIIVLCLLSERYLIHHIAEQRFSWFARYLAYLDSQLDLSNRISHPLLHLILILVPIILPISIVYYFMGHLIFGFIYFLLSLIIFYYCLGPGNIFYPLKGEEEPDDVAAKEYLALANRQLFSVIFWFIMGGPIAVLSYRLITLCSIDRGLQKTASTLALYLEWIPARLTLLLYLLVGNFQQGFQFFSHNLLLSPSRNDYLLKEGGALAAGTDAESFSMIHAENLVEHAVILSLVILALINLGAWFSW